MPSSRETLIERNALFKIEIDSSWSAQDFAILFDSINRLYIYQFLLIQSLETINELKEEFQYHPLFRSVPNEFKSSAIKIFQNPYSQQDNRVDEYVDDDHSLFILHSFMIIKTYPLSVNKVKFGSKGSVDLLGIGKIFEVIKDLIMNYIPNESEKLDNLIKGKELEEKEQQILQKKIENLRRLGLETDDILTVLGLESLQLKKINELLNQDKIKDLKI